MRCLQSLTAILVLAFSLVADAQPRNGLGRGGFSLPAVGSTLPDVTVFDEEGEPFTTTSLRGHYSVLVFGCLT